MLGLDAWLQLVRYIEHGRPTRLDTDSRAAHIAHQPVHRIHDQCYHVLVGPNARHHEHLEAGGGPLYNYDSEHTLMNANLVDIRQSLGL